ncbi:CHAP domain-containing protein [Massilia sp. R2A-15]|uniref:CHAP domain-containing protein n=1 Tax=Massilia sp. R2A-15 TaxID=3064278 RepID=UPI0027342A6E|nr:CHAP domain-containing protein [Massilia sp. R2A-15]WLI90647.1 CHAP domain-containing protein [Massilia sp. R2A-15]
MFNVSIFATHLRKSAVSGFGRGLCARYVRQALEDGGADTAGHPVSAKDWGPTLLRIGFQPIDIASIDGFVPQKGDVAVIQATSAHPHGHIQGFDGKNWISDFVQAAFWPGPAYRRETPPSAVYRPS